MHIQWVIIYPDTDTDIQRQWERNTNQETYVYTQNKNNIYIIYNTITCWESWSRLFTHLNITDNIPGYWDRQRERERENEKTKRRKKKKKKKKKEKKSGSRDVPIHVQSVTILPNTKTFTEKESKKHGSRDVHMSDNIVGHCYTHSDKKR